MNVLVPAAPRELCARCRRPTALCYCVHLRSLPTRARVLFLQHPRESRVPIGTARMAQLSLPNSELHRGVNFADNARVAQLVRAPGTCLLFPGEGALDPHQLQPDDLSCLVVIDGTWSQARKVLKQNPALGALPRVGLKPSRPGNYRIRLEPSAECLATIEAVASVLGVLERAPQRFEEMLAAFTYMVDRQLEHVGRSRQPRTHRSLPSPTSAEALLHAEHGQLVLLHAEVNAHARHHDVPGAPELLHLVARRTSGESFSAILAPRRPLAANAPSHLGLPAEQILSGESLDSARARWSSFSRPDDLHAGWGPFTREQLRLEALCSRRYLDLRPVVARRLQARPGAPEQALERLGGRARAAPESHRAGRVVTALEQLVAAL